VICATPSLNTDGICLAGYLIIYKPTSGKPFLLKGITGVGGYIFILLIYLFFCGVAARENGGRMWFREGLFWYIYSWSSHSQNTKEYN
jgi:hypothetical protein